jgi:hypothetical protein
MTGAPSLSWRTLPAAFRTLGRWLAVVQVTGYTTSLVFVWWTTRLSYGGVAARYRGDAGASSEAAMQFPKSLAEMLTITHTHLLAMAAVLAMTGAQLALCERVSPRWKHILIAESFAALLVSFSAMWLMRWVEPQFGYLLMASSGLLAVTFYVESFLVLRELGTGDRP